MAAVLQLAEGAAPATPGTGYHNLYPDTSGVWHTLDDAGTNKSLAWTDITLGTANVSDAAIVNSKLANMAESTVKGRAAAAGTGVPVDLTAAQVYAILKTTLDAAYQSGTTDVAWTNMTLGSGWVTTGVLYPSPVRSTTPAFTVPGYRKVNGVVYLRGAVNCDTATTTPIATLAAGYRPAYDMFLNIATARSTGTIVAQLFIGADGGLQLTANDTAYTYHFDGVCFVPA